jgi:hypothetical protein
MDARDLSYQISYLKVKWSTSIFVPKIHEIAASWGSESASQLGPMVDGKFRDYYRLDQKMSITISRAVRHLDWGRLVPTKCIGSLLDRLSLGDLDFISFLVFL